MTEPDTPPPLDPLLCADALKTCACSNFRKAARVLTQHFDEVLQPSGLRATQLVILLGVASNQSCGIAHLARELGMDASTLNRNLRPLIRRGLVNSDPSRDSRRRLLTLTDAGKQAIAVAVPLWERVQSQLVAKVGKSRWEQILGDIGEVVEAVRRK